MYEYLPTHMYVHYVYARCLLGVRGGCQIACKWSYRWLWAVIWVLGIKMSPLPEQQELRTTESSLQPECHHWSKKGLWPSWHKTCMCVYLFCHLSIYMFNMHGGFNVTSGDGESTSRGQHVPLLHRRCDIIPVTSSRHTPRPRLIKRGVTKHLMKRTPGRTRQALTCSVPERTQSN